jgi:hypothetical protein
MMLADTSELLNDITMGLAAIGAISIALFIAIVICYWSEKLVAPKLFTVYTGRNTKRLDDTGYFWLEVDEYSIPVHAADMETRINTLIASGIDKCLTVSPLALTICLKWIRKKTRPNIEIVWVSENGAFEKLQVDNTGEFIRPFGSEKWEENIFTAEFYHRYY